MESYHAGDAFEFSFSGSWGTHFLAVDLFLKVELQLLYMVFLFLKRLSKFLSLELFIEPIAYNELSVSKFKCHLKLYPFVVKIRHFH